MAVEIPRFIFAGLLYRKYVILPNDEILLDVPGGNVLHAAVGCGVWQMDLPPGLIARVGEDYPEEWLQRFAQEGFDTRGIQVLPEAVDLRYFAAYSDLATRHTDQPVAHFARVRQPFPKVLFDYQDPVPALDSRTKLTTTSLRQSDIPPEYLDATTAHLCPVDFLTHSALPAVLRQTEFTTLTLDPSSGYMNPTFWDNVPSLVNGLTAFTPLRGGSAHAFQGRSEDLWEMAEAMGAYGCEIVVIKRGLAGQLLYDAASGKRWEVPAYPAKVVDPMGVGDAFCGGFLAGFRMTYDPLQAVLHGNISASLAVEGSDPFYPLGVLPGLPEARLEALSPTVVEI